MLSDLLLNDWLMATLVLITAGITGWVAYQKHDWVLAVCVLPLAELALGYGLIAIDSGPLVEGDARAVLLRPGLMFFLVFMSIHLLNGKVNQGISKVVQVVRRWTNIS